MLVKRSRKNQVALPKSILERAGVRAKDRYFDVRYTAGRIILTPMQIEENISPEALTRFEARVLKPQPGDRSYDSMASLIRDLHRKRHARA